MTAEERSNLATIRTYLAALEAGTAGEELGRFFAPEAVQVEFPNKLNPNGGRSDVPTLLKRSEQGRQVLERQSYEIQSEIAQGSRVAVEAIWRGVLKVPLGTLQPGATMTAYFAMFFELQDGRIVAQRNYDCFEAF